MTTSGTAPAGRQHRRRAGLLGALGAVLLLALAAGTGRYLAATAAALADRPRVQMDEAVLVVALAALTGALAWIAVVTAACALDLVRLAGADAPSPSSGARAAGGGAHRLSPALAGRVTALLLALTAAGSLAPSGAAHAAPSSIGLPAPGFAATAPEQAGGPGPASLPVPGFAAASSHDSTTPTGPTTPVARGPQLHPHGGITAAADARTAASLAPLDAAGDDSRCAPGEGLHDLSAPDLPTPGWAAAGGLQRPSSTDRAGLLGRCREGADAEVVVVRGDSLWSIAQRHLGPDATPAEVAHETTRWYERNRAVIGDDPDLILPGTTLRTPHEEPTR